MHTALSVVTEVVLGSAALSVSPASFPLKLISLHWLAVSNSLPLLS
jgi:hypothetical protein